MKTTVLKTVLLLILVSQASGCAVFRAANDIGYFCSILNTPHWAYYHQQKLDIGHKNLEASIDRCEARIKGVFVQDDNVAMKSNMKGVTR